MPPVKHRSSQRYGELVASPDGCYLAFAAYDTEYARTLVVYDRVSDECFTVAASTSFGVPFSFTQNNELVCAVDDEFVTNAEWREVMQLQVYIQPRPTNTAHLTNTPLPSETNTAVPQRQPRRRVANFVQQTEAPLWGFLCRRVPDKSGV